MAKRTPKKATRGPGRPRLTGIQRAAAAVDEHEEESEGADALDLEEGDDAEASILAEFGAGDGANWSVRIYRHTGQRAGRMPYLFSCTPSDFPIIDLLRDKYRSGTYQARVFKDGRPFRNFLLDVEAPPADILPPGNAGAAGGDFGLMIAAMDRQSLQFTQALERLAPHGQAMSPNDQMAATFDLMAKMREAMGTPAAATAITPTDVIGLLKTGMSLRDDLSGEKEPATMFDIIRDVLKSPLVESLLKGMPSMPPGPGAAPQQLGAPPAPGQPQAEAPQQQPTPEQVQMAILAQNLRYLVGKAAANADTELYADWTMDNVPRQILEQIIGLDDPLAQLAQFEPTVSHHQGWFGSLIEELRETLTAPADGPNPPVHVP